MSSRDTDIQLSNKRKRGEHQYDGIEKTQSKQVKRSPELKEAFVTFGTGDSPIQSKDAKKPTVRSFTSFSHNTSGTSTSSSSSEQSSMNNQPPNIIFNINCRVNNSYYQTGTFHYNSQPQHYFNNQSLNTRPTNNEMDDESEGGESDFSESDSILTDMTHQ